MLDDAVLDQEQEDFTEMVNLILAVEALTKRIDLMEERSSALEYNHNVLLSVITEDTLHTQKAQDSRAETKEVVEEAIEEVLSSTESHKWAETVLAIKNLHRLSAAPLQWMTKPGSMSPQPAEPGMWSITCEGCKYQTQWNDGDVEPYPCPTVRLL